MLPTPEELTLTYSRYSNDRLLKIIYEKEHYRPEAVVAARLELNKRNVDIKEVKSFVRARKKKDATAQSDTQAEELEEARPIIFIEKLIFFTLGVFLEPYFEFSNGKTRSKRGVRQRRLFSLAGVVSVFLTIFIVLTFEMKSLYFIVHIFLLFMITYVVEKRIGAP
jgi:hypothetical protein